MVRSVSICVLAVALAGCSGGPPPATRTTPDAPNTGLDALAGGATPDLGLKSGSGSMTPPNADTSILAAQAALDLEAYFAAREKSQPETRAAAPSVAEASPAVLDAAAKAWDTPTPVPTPVSASPTVTPSTTAPGFVDADPVAAMARRMAALLLEPEAGRIPDAVALAAVESLRPGVLADLELPGNALHGRLEPGERAALLAARDRVLAHPSAANEALVKSLSKIAPAASVRIARGVLCTRVLGFGRYEPFETDRFVAGRALRVIVYTELEHFASRAAVAGDPAQPGVPLGEQYTVDLTQSLSLYHDPSGLLAWHKPAQKVVETTRGRRRDFYLIHTVELPASLTIGKYMLKATVTDKTTGASDEVNIPINIVAR
ncbi:MAG: hypothetical protein HBSAPP03_06190 [Phycisphaerae bacterium]|nr:MAG: hypothetical protein HBSAPP03_06190 [Phycisphaerae bacterium]